MTSIEEDTRETMEDHMERLRRLEASSIKDLGSSAAAAVQDFERGAAAATILVRAEEKVDIDLTATGPFANNKEIEAPSKVDSLMAQFTLEGYRIKTQSNTSYEIKGKSTPYNGTALHTIVKGIVKNEEIVDESLETLLREGKGSSIYFLLNHLAEIGDIICPSEGIPISIPQKDRFDGLAAYISEDRNPEDLLEEFESSLTVFENEEIFRSIRALVRKEMEREMERREEGERNGTRLYDAYVFTLITLFIWFELLQRAQSTHKSLMKAIDEFINAIWFFQDKISLQEVRDECLLYEGLFSSGNLTVEALSRNLSRATSIPERRDTSRITVKYGPKLLFDDWTIEQLIRSFYKDLYARNMKINLSFDQLASMIQSNFEQTMPHVDEPVEMTLDDMRIMVLYDERVLRILKIKKKDMSEDTAVINKSCTLDLVFESCTTHSLKGPRLIYTARLNDSDEIVASGIVQPDILFRHRDAYEILLKYHDGNKEIAYQIYNQLLHEIGTDEKIEVHSTPVQSPMERSPASTPSQRKKEEKVLKRAFLEYDDDDDSDSSDSDSDSSNGTSEPSSSSFRRTPQLQGNVLNLVSGPGSMQGSRSRGDTFDTPAASASAASGSIELTEAEIEKDTPQEQKVSLVRYLLAKQAGLTADSPPISPIESSYIDIGSYRFEGFYFGGTHKPRLLVYSDSRRDKSVKPVAIMVREAPYSRLLTRPFDVVSHGLNVLSVRGIPRDFEQPRFHESGLTATGLYPHQIQTIETIGRSLAEKKESTLILEASVGSGKTTVSIGLGMYIQLSGRNKPDNERPLLIYAASVKELFREMYNRCNSIGIDTVAVSKVSANKKGKGEPVVYYGRSGWIGSDQKPLAKASVAVCHIRTLVYLIGLLEKGDHTRRPYSIIVDEVTPGDANSPDEHALGIILSFKPIRHPKNIAIFSASVKGDGPIRYYTSGAGGVKVVSNSTTLVPTELRQLDGTLLDPYLGYDDDLIIKKVERDAFFRRYISYENVRLMKNLGERKHSFREESIAYFNTMARNNVLENSMVHNMYPFHKEIRERFPESFAIKEYPELTQLEKKSSLFFYKRYIVFLGSVVSNVESRVNTIVKNRRTDLSTLSPTELEEFMTYLSDIWDENNGRKARELMIKKKLSNTNTFTLLDEIASDFRMINAPRVFMKRVFEQMLDIEVERLGVEGDPEFAPKRRLVRDLLIDLRNGEYMDGSDEEREKMEEAILSVSKAHGPRVSLLAHTRVDDFERIQDEIRSIRQSPYYTLVACEDPLSMREELYGPAVTWIHTIINAFRSRDDLRDLILKERQNQPKATKGFVKNEKGQLIEKVDRTVMKRASASEDEKRVVKMHEYYEKDLARLLQREDPLANVDPIDEITRSAVDNEIAERRLHPGHMDFGDWLKYIKTNIGSRSDLRNVRELQNIGIISSGGPKSSHHGAKRRGPIEESMFTGKSDVHADKHMDKHAPPILTVWRNWLKNTRSGMEKQSELRRLLDELEKRCDVILSYFGIVHSNRIKLTISDIEEVYTGGREAIYRLIGVYAFQDTNSLPQDRKNRLFGNVELAKGIDLPLQSVVITESFADAYTADDILQIGGRCGRPSRSVESVVVMSASTYRKSITKDPTESLVYVMLRYMYYREKDVSKITGDAFEKNEF